MREIIFTADRIAELLTPAGETPRTPTPEQKQVIEAELEGSTIVIAGAGSGKTETMANRVVWLVANGIVEPAQVLGLTFTRKAAQELRERVNARLRQLAVRLSEEEKNGTLTDKQAALAHILHNQLITEMVEVEVGTYNGFASRVANEFGVRAGLPTNLAVLDEAMAYGIARGIVCDATDDWLSESGSSINAITENLVTLQHEISDNFITTGTVRKFCINFEKDFLATLQAEKQKLTVNAQKLLDDIRATYNLCDLVDRYADAKLERGQIEFSDQLNLAYRAIQDDVEAVPTLRDRYRVVLLDEVQDTSVSQSIFLSRIFRDHPVMAVGDPHQSIYGWRGASADSMGAFHNYFAQADTTPRRVFNLSISWRNQKSILALANTVAGSLERALRASGKDLQVKPLSPNPFSGDGVTQTMLAENSTKEAGLVAAWLAHMRRRFSEEKGKTPTAAIVLRRRQDMQLFSQELAKRGVPNIIVGLGGLLTTPEITDIVSCLKCVWQADAGNELIRILVGPRYEISPADLLGLRKASSWLRTHDSTGAELSQDEFESLQADVSAQREVTILDALDEIAGMTDLAHPALYAISWEGKKRLREAGQMLSRLRSRAGGSVIETIQAVITELRLDIELDANEALDSAGSALAHANIERFITEVQNYVHQSGENTLGAVLAWLEYMREQDTLPEHVQPPQPGTVQITTIHSAKGLEWDIVAVPQNTEGVFPSAPRDTMGGYRKGHVPEPLKGDSASRPELHIGGKRINQVISDFQDQQKDLQLQEETRLLYVAITRAAHYLLISGSNREIRAINYAGSEFIQALRNGCEALYWTEQFFQEPEEQAESMQWPPRPLGSREKAVSAAAKRIRQEIERQSCDESVRAEVSAALTPTLQMLLAERAQAAEMHSQTHLGNSKKRLNASSLYKTIKDPNRNLRFRLRPIPTEPTRASRLGTLFHEWVERRNSTALGTAIALPGLEPRADSIAAEIEVWQETPGADLAEQQEEFAEQHTVQGLTRQEENKLAKWQETFAASRWGERKPIAVELSVALPFAGTTMICQIDAVYENQTDSGVKYELVDWKTGRVPTKTEEAEKFLQLEVYRHAFAKLRGISSAEIAVTLFYVDAGKELRLENPRTLEELEAAYREAVDRNSK